MLSCRQEVSWRQHRQQTAIWTELNHANRTTAHCSEVKPLRGRDVQKFITDYFFGDIYSRGAIRSTDTRTSWLLRACYPGGRKPAKVALPRKHQCRQYSRDSDCSSHLKTPHFQKYKKGTLSMVKELELIDMKPLIPGLTKKSPCNFLSYRDFHSI